MIRVHHGGPSGHSASLLIALAEKALPFEERRIDLAAFAQHGADFLAINPDGQVPVLQQDGRTLTETFFILLYIDELHPDPPLGGADPRARYAVQKWGKYVETHIAPQLAVAGWAAGDRSVSAEARAGFERLTPARRALWMRAADGFSREEVDVARAALAKAVGRISADLARGPWLAGEAYGLADIITFPHVARLPGLAIDLPAEVADWSRRVAERPAVRAALDSTGLDTMQTTMGPERGRWG